MERYDPAVKIGRRIRRSSVITVDSVLAATAREYGVSSEAYCGFRSSAGGRDVAAYLCRRYTTATLAELSHRFGLSDPDSSSDLVKRAKRKHETSTDISNRIGRIEKRLGLNPESRDWTPERCLLCHGNCVN